MIRVTVWNENRSEQLIPEMKEVYPDGLHGALASFLGKEADFEVRRGHAGSAGSRTTGRGTEYHRCHVMVGSRRTWGGSG